MKREFLKELGLSEEQVNSIMTENGKDIEKHKTDLEKVKQEATKTVTELEGLKTQLKEANAQIQGFKNLDIEGIKKSVDDWKAKYKEDTEKLKAQIAQKDYDFSLEKYLGKHEFTSDFAKKAFIEEFKKKELKFEEGKFLGADEFINEFKNANAGVFKEEVTEPATTSTYTYKPKGSSTSGGDLAAQALAAVKGTI